jgi:quinol monooxygenase YgiN
MRRGGAGVRHGMSAAKRAGMVRLAVALRGSARHAQELVETFRFLIVSTRLEPGCLGCSAWADPDSTVHYVEEWTTEPEMRRRVQSPSFTSLLAVLESAREPPRIQFQFVTTTRGLDYVEEVRRDTAS